MTEKKVDVGIELCGYRGKISGISGQQSQVLGRPEAKFHVWIEFDQPYPEGIISMPVAIPVKEYSRYDLLETIQKEGEKQVEKSLSSSRRANEEARRMREAQRQVEDLAAKMEELLKP